MSESKENQYTYEQLMKMKKPELSSICKEKKLFTTGNKTDLIERILTNSNVSKKKTTPEKNSSTTTGTQPSKQTSKQPSKQTKTQPTNTTTTKPVFKRIREQFTEEKKEPILIKRNKHGNFEHLDTKLVFNMGKKVIGVQSDDGNINNLSLLDIENVYKYHFELEKNIVIDDKPSISVTDEKQQEERIAELLRLTATTEKTESNENN